MIEVIRFTEQDVIRTSGALGSGRKTEGEFYIYKPGDSYNAAE